MAITLKLTESRHCACSCGARNYHTVLWDEIGHEVKEMYEVQSGPTMFYACKSCLRKLGIRINEIQEGKNDE